MTCTGGSHDDTQYGGSLRECTPSLRITAAQCAAACAGMPGCVAYEHALSEQTANGDSLITLCRMCLFFWLKNFEGSEKVLHLNFFHSQFNLRSQCPVFFPDQHP